MDGENEGRGSIRFRIALAAIGLLQGIGFYILDEADWKQHQTLMLAGAAFCFTGPPTLQLLYQAGPLRRALAAALGLAVPLALLVGWFDWRVTGGTIEFDDHWWAIFIPLAIIAYIAWPFAQTWAAQTGAVRWRERFPYTDLFRFAWSNILVAAVAGVFVGVFRLVLLLWSELFQLVDIEFFERLFREPLFHWPVMCAVFGFGIAVARENERLVPVLRRVVLMLFQVLAPVLGGAALLFLVFLPVTGLQPLWETRYATGVLVMLLFGLTLFINAVIQDGTQPVPFGRWMNWLMAVIVLTLPVFAVLAFLALRMRIDQYGLTPERFGMQFVVIAAGLHAFAYAAGVLLKRQAWTVAIAWVNPWLAPVVALLALLILTPLADPYSRSASDQVDRLTSGKADAYAFDYRFLRFALGQPGTEALEEIRLIRGHPQQAAILSGVAEAEKAKDYRSRRKDDLGGLTAAEVEEIRQKLVVRPGGAALPDGVLRALSRDRGWILRQCLGDERCGVQSIDLDRDGIPEHLVVSSIGPLWGTLVVADGESWTVSRREYQPDQGHKMTDSDWAAFLAGDVEALPARYDDLRIGQRRLHD